MPRLSIAGGSLDQHPLFIVRLTVVRRADPHCTEARRERSGGAFAPGNATQSSTRQTARQVEYRDRRVRGIADRSGARSTSLALGA